MNNFFNMIMASGGIWDVWPIIKIIALVIMSICALFANSRWSQILG